MLDLGVVHELVEKSGSWFSFAGERIGQGRENARAFLVANPQLREQLDAALRKQLGFNTAGDAKVTGQPAAMDQFRLTKTA